MSKKRIATKRKKKLQHAQDSKDGPGIPYALNLKLTSAEWAELLKQPALVVAVALSKPVERHGEQFTWFVHPVKFTPEGKCINLGKQILCRDEIEANLQRERLLSMFKEQEKERKRKEAERPIPGEVLESEIVIRGRSLRIDAIPISLLRYTTGGETPSHELPPDKPFIDIGHAYWRSADGTGQAALSIAREAHEFVNVFRLIRYTQPVERDSQMFPFGVEFAECDLQLKPLRVMERLLFTDQLAAAQTFKTKQAEATRLRAQLLQARQMSTQERKEEDQIRQLNAVAEKTHDPRAKKRHLEVIKRIRLEQRERQLAQAQADVENARLERQQHQAFGRLIREYFPTVAEVKARRNDISVEQLASWKEELRRALRVDCARLGIISPFNNFALDGALAKQVARAMEARSPVKPEQVEAVLNWIAKGYQTMPEEDWTAAVSTNIGAPVSRRGLGKTVSQKFGLKSRLKGRPETGSGKKRPS